MNFITSTEMAEKIAKNFKEIKARGGHAAIDYCNGEIILQCTKPTDNPKTWGRGAVPQTYGGNWVRLVEC